MGEILFGFVKPEEKWFRFLKSEAMWFGFDLEFLDLPALLYLEGFYKAKIAKEILEQIASTIWSSHGNTSSK